MKEFYHAGKGMAIILTFFRHIFIIDFYYFPLSGQSRKKTRKTESLRTLCFQNIGALPSAFYEFFPCL